MDVIGVASSHDASNMVDSMFSGMDEKLGGRLSAVTTTSKKERRRRRKISRRTGDR